MIIKSKKNIYILLPVVLLVWGLVVYRIYSAVNPGKINSKLVNYNVPFNPTQFKEATPFTIKTNYRDPFLGTMAKKKQVKVKRIKKKKVQQPVLPFPQIIYKGVVSNQSSKTQVFIVNINGKQHFFMKNQIQQEIELLKGDFKSITLKFKGQQQSFSISK